MLSHRPGMTAELNHAQKVALADLNAVVAQDAVCGGGVEKEIGEGNAVDELLALQGRGAVGPGGKGHILAVGAFELLSLTHRLGYT